MIKVNGKVITLPVEGREITFREEELIAILEEYFKMKVAQPPTEGNCFEVNPNSIKQELFQKERKYPAQERTRKIILKALREVKKHPERYAKPFKTLIPKLSDCEPYLQSVYPPTVQDLINSAKKNGDHIANWVEQALEWAQRISNGEDWKAICNDSDAAEWYRLVIWKNGYTTKRVGGASHIDYKYPASRVSDDDFYSHDYMPYTVPLIVL